jgi:hypothetical protein
MKGSFQEGPTMEPLFLMELTVGDRVSALDLDLDLDLDLEDVRRGVSQSSQIGCQG